MIIAMAANGPDLEADVGHRLGSSPYLLLIDVETLNFEAIPIPFKSVGSGIESMGPVYAWYPLLKGLRERNVSDFHLTNFLSNRAIKPFLFPVMVFYFGWIYTVILNLLILIGSLLTAEIVSICEKKMAGTD